MPSHAVSLYRSIMKGTILFGGTQIVSILANVLRGKMVAVLLMTAGLGISAIYANTLMPLQQLFSMGMPIAVVGAIAATAANDDEGRHRVAAQVTAFRRCLLLLALSGAVFMALAAPWLSQWGFNSAEHTLPYVLLAAALFFLIMESGETAVLQSRRQMKQVATRNVIQAIASLIVGVPFYWWLGIEGIVPAIILNALIVWIYSRWQTHRLRLAVQHQPWSETWQLTRGIMALGFFMMLAALLGNITNYGVTISISRLGSLGDVGLYQASTSITSQYVGFVFAAMATDYYPRLASLTASIDEVKRLIRQELELVLLIVTPVVLLIIVTAPILIRVLLTAEFLPLTSVVRLTGLAIICKAACFPLDYVSMAYGNKRYFFWMEGVWCNAKTFAVTILFYWMWGVEGFGWGVLVSGLIDVLVTVVMTHIVFGISSWRLQLRLFVPLIAAAGTVAALSFADSVWINLAGMITAATILAIACLYLLARRVGLKEWWQQRKEQNA